ncbi:MAG: oxidoreductase [Candidatus Hydrogenedentes bacterium]|nr:oxidoreductase [Candidatus Hydrogenedentota bacterium]
MNPIILIMTLAGPTLLASVALLARFSGGGPRIVLFASRIATAVALLVALGSAAYTALAGPATGHITGWGPFSLAIRLDALSVTMLLLVAFIGAVVVQFSRNYVDGDPRQGWFTGRLCLTLGTVLILVLAGSLFQLVLAWIGTSVALHRLLLYYQDRPSAVLAARKKFICSRIGDAFLVLAAILLYAAFGTGDIAQMLKMAREMSESGEAPTSAVAAALSLVMAALFKSAQFPVHGWLTEVMETPTPVSALLHAGIVNAGGFLMVRMADVLVICPPAMYLLIVAGGVTALVATAVMLTQTSVKVALAWSTIAQMGFMLLQCGLGAFSAAALHIVAHSVYKAHAFLSAGSAVDAAAALPATAPCRGPRPAVLAAAALIATLIFLACGALWGVSPREKPAIVALGAVLIMGLTHLLARGLAGANGDHFPARLLTGVTLLSMAYFGLQAGASWILNGVVPAAVPLDTFGLAATATIVLLFGGISVAQLYAAHWLPRFPSVYVHLANGLYANTLLNGLMRSPSFAADARN